MATKKKQTNKVAPKKGVVKSKTVKKETKKVVVKASAAKKPAVKKSVAKPIVKAKPVAKKAIAKPLVKKGASKVVVKATAKKVAPKSAPKKNSVKKTTPTKSIASKVVIAKKSAAKKVVSKPIVSKTAIKSIPPIIANKQGVKKIAKIVEHKKVDFAKTSTKNTSNSKNKEVKKVAISKAPTHSYIKYELEFPMHASRHSIFNFVTDASALSAWFADNVNLINEEYVFTWDGTPQRAKVLSWKESQLVRYHWLHEPDGTYFEFSIVEDELTSDLALIVTDFAEDVASIDAAKRLWQSQIADLHHVIGG